MMGRPIVKNGDIVTTIVNGELRTGIVLGSDGWWVTVKFDDGSYVDREIYKVSVTGTTRDD